MTDRARSGEGGHRPLADRTVVVTRPEHRAPPLVSRLEARGARVLLLPAIVLAPPEDPGPFRRAVATLESHDWVVFTSPAGVRAVARAREGEAGSAGGPGLPRVAVVGRGTAAAVERAGWAVGLVPETFTGEGLLEAFDEAGVELEGARILLPLAEAAREVVPEGLASRGALVARVTAYRAVRAPEERTATVARAVERGEVDLLTFTSPSTAESFLELVGPGALGVPAAVIGPITGSAARELGYRVVAVAEPHSVDGLVAAVVDALAG